MKFFVQRKDGGLMPCTAEDAAALAKLPFGKPIQVEAITPRNGRHLALYWILCQRIANAIGAEPENVSNTIKLATGHYTAFKTKTYGTVKIPASISFAKMREEDFRDFFERCCQVISTEWGIEKPEVLAAVEDILIPTEVR